MHEADLVIATTRSMSLDLAWRYQLPGDSLREVPNYVLTELGGTGLDDREKGLILSAGELTPRKRFDILVRAVALLPEAVRATSRRHRRRWPRTCQPRIARPRTRRHDGVRPRHSGPTPNSSP